MLYYYLQVAMKIDCASCTAKPIKVMWEYQNSQMLSIKECKSYKACTVVDNVGGSYAMKYNDISKNPFYARQ